MVNAKFETDSGKKREFIGKDLVMAVGITENDFQGQICIMTDIDKGVSGTSVLSALAELVEQTICEMSADDHTQTVFYLNSLMKEIERYRDEYIKRNMKELIREMVGTGEDRYGD